MWIARLVGELVVQPVHTHPVDGAALQRHGAAGGDDILQPARHCVTAMRQQTVIADGDANVLTEDPEHDERR